MSSRAAILSVLVTAAGYTAGPPPADLDSPLPASRMQGVLQAGPEDQRRLIEQLDSGDAGVRLLAITTLEAQTGETYGYDPVAPRIEREAAIRRWAEAAGGGGQP